MVKKKQAHNISRLSMRTLNPLILIVVLCTWQSPLANDFATYNQQGEAAFVRGDYVNATQHWQAAVDLPNLPANQHVIVLSRLAAAYQAQGRLREMFLLLNEARQLKADNLQQAQVYAQFSDAWLSTGDVQAALEHAEMAVQSAQKTSDAFAQANALFSRANAHMAMFHDAKAQADLAHIRTLLPAQHRLVIKAELNWATMTLLFENFTATQQSLQAVYPNVQQLPDADVGKIDRLLTLAVLYQDLHRHTETKQPPLFDNATHEQFLVRAEISFRQALQFAEQQGTPHLRTRAYGRLGNLYEYLGREQIALRLTQQAIFHAEQADYPELLYRWYWQKGRLFKHLKQDKQALAAYRRAVRVLRPVQHQLSTGYRIPPENFNQAVRPVYYELADLLLRQAQQTQGEQNQALLQEAMDTIEWLKVSELQDYFKSECVAGLQPHQVDLAVVAPNTAVLYPIPLDDRLVLLVNLGDHIYQVETLVSREKINNSARLFHSRVQNRVNHRYLYLAQDLYDYLIRPVLDQLRKNKVKTLVIAPDGVLRTIPFATFHDGKRFLIEEFEIVTTPSLNLTDPQPIEWENSHILLAGLSDAVQGFDILPNVPKELNSVKNIAHKQVQNIEQLMNQAYTLDGLTQSLTNTPYSIVHLATHGEFSNNPEQTYLLTYQEKLHMDQLQDIIGLGRFRDTPVELLTLSACKTATGNDRAALGLAGVAIKAGARSALASLWYIDDKAASLLIADFYRLLLEQPNTSKAKALQGAQQNLINQVHYQHPAYWGPFLLIGNWL